MSPAATWRTHRCGDLRASDIGEKVVVCGWVANRRNHGGVYFVDLRDRAGILQLIADDDATQEARDQIGSLHPEYVVQVHGVVRPRIEGQKNKDRATGEVELLVEKVSVLSKSQRLPFEIQDELDVPEQLRMKYRYLDLRRRPMQRLMELRSKANHAVRCALVDQGFTEVETPMMTRSTPEGARDYLVPSRVRPGTWYALPQSPQVFKQLCMVGGLDRYFQIARCMRDEDLRADRQPEFSQLDMEMSFVTEDEILAMVEQVMASLYRDLLDRELELPVERMSYREAMDRFASDKPDLRIPIEIVDLGEVAGMIGFGVYRSVLEAGGWVRGFRVPGGGSLSRKQITSLEQTARDAGAGGAAWCKVTADGATGPLGRFLGEQAGADFIATLGAETDDLILTIADQPRRTLVAVDAIRRAAGEMMGMVGEKDRLVWITEFPLFEQGDDGEWAPAHHPFTAPVSEDLEALLGGQKEGIRSRAYDLVLNGVELGSGSIRIHDRELQEAIFASIGMEPEEAQRRFQHLLEAFRYGAPPHGGFAIGLDRLYALMFGADSIRDVIAFPKTASAACPLTEAPAPVDTAQLAELGLALLKQPTPTE
ncbi:MAG: aspartate--tRNA ligase [Planctomycetes bacterium]|nr:aspartate--tRNA ligase [Planctomycetota bacterium]